MLWRRNPTQEKIEIKTTNNIEGRRERQNPGKHVWVKLVLSRLGGLRCEVAWPLIMLEPNPWQKQGPVWQLVDRVALFFLCLTWCKNCGAVPVCSFNRVMVCGRYFMCMICDYNAMQTQGWQSTCLSSIGVIIFVSLGVNVRIQEGNCLETNGPGVFLSKRDTKGG